MCWSAEALAFKEGDDRIRRGTRKSLIAPPNRTPIAADALPPDDRRVIRRVKLPPGVKLVALTFDLCEQPYEIAGYQGDIVDYLREHQIKATFFAGGKWMLTHKVRTEQLMSDPLFEIGNHTWEHRNLRLLKAPVLEKEIESAQTAYEQVREELAARQCLGRDGVHLAHRYALARMSLFRFPFGACNDQALDAVGERGLKAIQWDVSSGDPSIGQSADMIIKAVMSRVRPGSIIVFHANGRGWHTSSALPEIVQALKRQGYSFATVSELLSRGVPEYSAICYDRRPGDTDRYDALALSLDRAYALWRQKVLSGPIGPKAAPAPDPGQEARSLRDRVQDRH
jgi:peptidoglycan/xylan/chitin deacetylase (PgdA/CDA1 family)